MKTRLMLGITAGLLSVSAQALALEPKVEQVRSQFLHAWNSYVEHAWGHDEVKPLSHGHRDWYGQSLLMTPVDALDTMIIMGLQREAVQTRDLIARTLNFDRDMSVIVFETTIRLLGGLESSYELTHDERLLKLATDLGNRLLPAFESPTGMPYRMVNLKTGEASDSISNPAEIGTLMLEFGTLSRLTGNQDYYDKAKKAVVALFSRSSSIGLVGTTIDVESGRWLDPVSHVGSRIDSYYEYLYKAWLLFGDRDFLDMWTRARDALNTYVADDVNGELWYGRVDMDTGKRVATTYGALEAFLPGLLALSGDLDRARRLQESGYKMWDLDGIEPEQLDYRTHQVTDGYYGLRPEIIESAYYLRYFTREKRYDDMAGEFFDSFVKYCRVDGGFAELKDVSSKTKIDSMQSFLFAETLKYLYLMFAPLDTLDLSKVVINTEGHPLQKL